MPNTALSNQLPPRTTTSTRGSRKCATLGGRQTSSASTTRIPINDSEINENISKTNGHQRQSSSLFRKSSTISRTNDTPNTSEEINTPSLKKSRSLMNVLRSKINSPAVLRRFRSKSRESTKQTVIELNKDTTNDEQQEIKQSNTEQTTTTTTRKSRKRDPSPMRRLANRITQLTRHHKTTSTERQKKSPSKSITNDSHDETRKSTTPLHNKDEVEHINACYDEIRAKYFTNNTNTNKRNISNDETQNHSLFNNDFLNNSQRINSPLPTLDDPLLQARKQANIKLNCMLSGYTLTTSFANHEKLYGQHDLFKFNHYYDVGKRKYDYNFTSNNNRIFSSMKTRPISKSIDSFRRTNINENEVPLKLEKINIVNNEPSVQVKNHEDIPRILPNDNELFIHEDNDLIKSEQNTLQYSTNIQETSTLSNENKITSTTEEHDEEFERNFLRAVDRALGVVNKEENDLIQTDEDIIIPTKTDESHLNLFQMTEQALSSLHNSSLFTNDEQKHEQTENKKEIEHTEIVGHTDVPLKTEQQSTVDTEKPADEDLTKIDLTKSTNEDLLNVSLEKSADEESSKVATEKAAEQEPLKVETEKSDAEKLSQIHTEKPADEESAKDTEKLVDQEPSQVHIEKPADQEPPQVHIEKPADQEPSQVHIEKPGDEESAKDTEKLVDKEPPQVHIEKPADQEPSQVHIEKPADQELSQVHIEKPADQELSQVHTEETTDEESSKVDTEKSTVEEPSKVDIEKPADEELSKVGTEKLVDEESSIGKLVDEESPKVDAEKSVDQELSQIPTEKPTDEELSKIDTEKSVVEEPSKVNTDKPADEESFKVDTEKPANEESSNVDTEKSTVEEPSNVDTEKPADQELPTIDIEEATDKHLSNVGLSNVNIEKPVDELSSGMVIEKSIDQDSSKTDIEKLAGEDLSMIDIEKSMDKESTKTETEKTANDDLIDEDICLVIDELTRKVDELLFEDSKNGQTFLTKLDDEEKIIKAKSDAFNKILQTNDNRLTEDVRTDINAVIGEVNLLLKGKLKQFRGLCEANVTKSTSGQPIPLDNDLEGFWDITYPLIDKVKEKFSKLDARKAKQWALIEEYDPDDVNNRPRVIDDRLKQLQSQQNKTSKIPITKAANEDLKKLIQERRKAAVNTTNQNHDVKIFVTPK